MGQGFTNQDVKLGIIGIGAMGKGLFYQSTITPGIAATVICDIKLDRCLKAADLFGCNYQIVDTADEMTAAIENGILAICTDGELLARCKLLDAVIEATGTIIDAARFAVATLETKKHLILMNSEIDLILGPYLKQLAEVNGVVCTSSDGDQYGVMKHMIDDLHSWGFELVMTGNVKGFLNRYAHPDMMIEEARKRNLNVRACTSFTDGTKLNIEMALIANAQGMQTPCPGMWGPRLDHINHVLEAFDFNALWQERERQPLVDYILGAEPGGGVFVIGYCDNDYQRDMLKYYKMGEGPYYLFYRHYHLCHIESMSAVFDAVRNKRALLQPEYGFVTNVYAYAKQDLAAGEILDGIGGFTCYGLIENQTENIEQPGLPICLADQITLRSGVKKDQKILLKDVCSDAERLDFKLYSQACRIGGAVNL